MVAETHEQAQEAATHYVTSLRRRRPCYLLTVRVFAREAASATPAATNISPVLNVAAGSGGRAGQRRRRERPAEHDRDPYRDCRTRRTPSTGSKSLGGAHPLPFLRDRQRRRNSLHRRALGRAVRIQAVLLEVERDAHDARAARACARPSSPLRARPTAGAGRSRTRAARAGSWPCAARMNARAPMLRGSSCTQTTALEVAGSSPSSSPSSCLGERVEQLHAGDRDVGRRQARSSWVAMS